MSWMDRILGRQAAPAPARVEPAPPVAPVAAAATSGTSRPDPAFWDVGWTGTGQSRVRSLPPVSSLTAQRHATVFACCNNIAGDLAKLPLQVRQRTKAGQDVAVDDHPAAYLLNVEASPSVPAITARFALAYAFALRGRSYAFAPRDGAGELVMIDTLLPDSVAMMGLGRARYYDFTDGDQVQRRAPARSMIHLRYMAEDGWTGRSPIEVAAESFGLALAGQEAAARSASGTQMRAYAKLEGVYEDDETYRRNARRLRNALNDPETNGIPILGEAEEIKSLDLSASDMQLLESRKFDREQICAAYRMPPSKIQAYEYGLKASGQQQALDYKTECLTHWAGFIEAQMGQALLTESERRAGLYLAHDYDELLVATTRERFEAWKVAVGGPWALLEEARAANGLAPLPPGRMPYPPSNMNANPGQDAPAKTGG